MNSLTRPDVSADNRRSAASSSKEELANLHHRSALTMRGKTTPMVCEPITLVIERIPEQGDDASSCDQTGSRHLKW